MKLPVSINLKDYPEYTGALAKLHEVQGRLREAEALVDRFNTELGRAQLVGSGNGLTRLAQAALDGAEPTTLGMEATRQSLAQAHLHRRVLREAVEIQKRAVSKARDNVVMLVKEKLEHIHRANVQRVASAVAELAKAVSTEGDFRAMIRDADLGEPFDPMPYPGIGRLDDWQSRANVYLRDAEERGFVERGTATRPK